LREAVARVLGAKEQRSEIPLVTRYSLQDVLDPSVSLRVLLAEDNRVNQRLGVRLLKSAATPWWWPATGVRRSQHSKAAVLT